MDAAAFRVADCFAGAAHIFFGATRQAGDGDVVISAEMADTASKSPWLVMGNPASMMSTPSCSSAARSPVFPSN